MSSTTALTLKRKMHSGSGGGGGGASMADHRRDEIWYRASWSSTSSIASRGGEPLLRKREPPAEDAFSS